MKEINQLILEHMPEGQGSVGTFSGYGGSGGCQFGGVGGGGCGSLSTLLAQHYQVSFLVLPI